MLHSFINPPVDPSNNNEDGTAMTHRTASQSFEMRRQIEKQRSMIGSYEAAAKKSLIEAHGSATSTDESPRTRAGYYDELRQTLGIKNDDTKKNPYNSNRQSDDISSDRGGALRSDRPQTLGVKKGSLSIPKRPSGPTFREPQSRSFNPFS